MGSSSIFARTVRVGLVDMFGWNLCVFFLLGYGGGGVCRRGLQATVAAVFVELG